MVGYILAPGSGIPVESGALQHEAGLSPYGRGRTAKDGAGILPVFW